MKILFYHYALNMGGIERTIAALANCFCGEHEVLVAQYTADSPFYPLDERVRHIPFGFEPRGNVLIRTIRLYRTIRRLLKKEKPDVVFCMNKTHLRLFCLAKHGLCCAVIGAERSNPLSDQGKRAKALRKQSVKADGFVFQTERAKSAYPEKTREKGIVIPNAICNEDVFAAENFPKEKIVVSVGRLETVKGYDLLIRAFHDVAGRLSEYRLNIYGKGTQKEALQREIDSLGMQDRIKLLGDDLHAYLQVAKCEIFVLSSRSEGMPNTLLEALACGVACIAADCNNGPAELIRNEENGLLVPVEDVSALSAAIVRLAEDEDLRKKFESCSEAIRQAHTMEAISQQWLLYAGEILNRCRRSNP